MIFYLCSYSDFFFFYFFFCGNNNKDENNSPKTLNDKNQQASFQKFRNKSYLFLFISIYLF